MLHRYGTSRLMRSKSSNVSSAPASWAMLIRCSTVLVEAPIAITARTPFSRAARVRILRAVSPSAIISTTRLPLCLA